MKRYLITFEHHEGGKHWRDSTHVDASDIEHAIEVSKQFCNFTVMNQTDHFAWLNAGGTKRVFISIDE